MKQVTYLAHHGVLGMKWGVRNAETLERYARNKPRSIKKKDTKTGYTLEKGSTFHRFDSPDTRKDLLKRQKTYVSQNDNDTEIYRKNLNQLPSVSWQITPKVVSTKLSAIDDVNVMKGEEVFNNLMEDYGDIPISHLDSVDSMYVFINTVDALKSRGYSDEKADIEAETMPFREAYEIRPKYEIGSYEEFYRKALGETVFHNPETSEKTIEKFRNQGVDAIEDIENQNLKFEESYLEAPLVIINPDKFKIESTEVLPKKKLMSS